MYDAKIKMLLVDDYSTIRKALKRSLANLGFANTHEAASGAEALTVLKAAQGSGDPFKILFLDITMPEMTGLEVLGTVRKDPSYADLAVIMVTAEGERKSIIQANQLGADSYILKPFSDQILREKLELVYNSRTGGEI